MKGTIFFYIFISVVFINLHSQAQQILFRNYTVADGLPSSTVRAIIQDDQGYMWFGTKNGLSRFDGYQFKTFQYSKTDPGSVGNNFIHCIARIDPAQLWAGTENGVYILDLETEIFTAFKGLEGKTILNILKANDGMIWIATRLDGLYLYNPAEKKLQHFRKGENNRSISANQTTRLAQDAQGNIWIGTFGNGLDIYNPATKTFRNISSGGNGISNDFINCLYKGIDGDMWIGTMNGGLCRWQQRQQTFKTYASGGNFSISDNIVRAICQTSPGKLYVGTEKGLNVLDLATDRFTAYTNQGNDPFSISDNAIYSIFSDKSGTLWAGTYFGGVNYYNEHNTIFELYYPTGSSNALSGRAVSCFLEDAPGKFWIGTEDGGLQYFNAADKTFQRYPFLPKQQKLSYHNIHSLVKDKNKNLWIGLFAGGINIYNSQTGRVTYFTHQPANQNSLNSNNVFCIYEDREGVMWIGTDKGLNSYNDSTASFKRIHHEGIDNTIIYDVYEDNNKTLWFATYNNGLLSYNKKTQEWGRITAEDKVNPLASNKLTCLYDDGDGNLWIGSDGGGLHEYNFKTRQLRLFNDKGSIAANVIYGIQKDDNGLIWVTTNNGIYSIEALTGKVKHYTKQDNLQSQQFNYKAFYKASDGKLFAGGIKGFNAFLPESLVPTTVNTAIAFTNFQLFNKDVVLSESGSPLQKQINHTSKLVLNYDQSVMSFEFAALNFNAPEKLSYAYKMEGFDPDWNYVGGQRKATYTNLSPGKYTFKVKATADESNWQVPEKAISIVIKPPFYKTVLAYILYFLFASALAFALYKYSAAYIKKQNQIKIERLKNKEEQEFYARKIEFFTVMAHEIRTPLSLIIAPLEKLLSINKWHKEEREQLTIMDENAERLMGLVNQLLDFRRIESDAYEIKKEEVEIVSLVQSIYSRFSSLPYQKDIEFTMTTTVSKLNLQADPEVLNKILSNLLINAFKFARKKVNITVSEFTKSEEAGQFVSVSVQDDGIGIPNTDIRNIFKKFFTTTSGNHEYHNLGGTGIGLALASALAEKHGGNLLVESREGSKTIFTLEIPYAAELIKNEVLLCNDDENLAESNTQPMVLVVEDDEGIQSFVAKSLRQEGYRVMKAFNGRQALQLLETADADLILSDVMMPEMDGFEFCKTVKTTIEYSHIPVVLLTAKGNKEAEIEGIETGADAYILKPFKWKHIAAVVKNLLDSRRTMHQKFSEQPQVDATVLTTNTRDKAFIEKVIGIIELRIIDPQLSVEELSKDLAMSRSSLHKKLKSLSGIVPNELIKLVRLKHAAKLLVAGENNISEVAYLAGFSSPSYFSKCFLQQFKVTPKEYADSQLKPGVQDIEDLLG